MTWGCGLCFSDETPWELVLRYHLGVSPSSSGLTFFEMNVCGAPVSNLDECCCRWGTARILRDGGIGCGVGVCDGYESRGRELSPNAGGAVREREVSGTPSELQLSLITHLCCRTLCILLYNTRVRAATVHLQV